MSLSGANLMLRNCCCIQSRQCATALSLDGTIALDSARFHVLPWPFLPLPVESWQVSSAGLDPNSSPNSCVLNSPGKSMIFIVWYLITGLGYELWPGWVLRHLVLYMYCIFWFCDWLPSWKDWKYKTLCWMSVIHPSTSMNVVHLPTGKDVSLFILLKI